jgi:hypothetical protein
VEFTEHSKDASQGGVIFRLRPPGRKSTRNSPTEADAHSGAKPGSRSAGIEKATDRSRWPSLCPRGGSIPLI